MSLIAPLTNAVSNLATAVDGLTVKAADTNSRLTAVEAQLATLHGSSNLSPAEQAELDAAIQAIQAITTKAAA